MAYQQPPPTILFNAIYIATCTIGKHVYTEMKTKSHQYKKNTESLQLLKYIVDDQLIMTSLCSSGSVVLMMIHLPA